MLDSFTSYFDNMVSVSFFKDIFHQNTETSTKRPPPFFFSVQEDTRTPGSVHPRAKSNKQRNHCFSTVSKCSHYRNVWAGCYPSEPTSSVGMDHDGGNGSHQLTSPASAKMLPVHLSGSQRRRRVPTNGRATGNAHSSTSFFKSLQEQERLLGSCRLSLCANFLSIQGTIRAHQILETETHKRLTG